MFRIRPSVLFEFIFSINFGRRPCKLWFLPSMEFKYLSERSCLRMWYGICPSGRWRNPFGVEFFCSPHTTKTIHFKNVEPVTLRTIAPKHATKIQMRSNGRVVDLQYGRDFISMIFCANYLWHKKSFTYLYECRYRHTHTHTLKNIQFISHIY